MVSPIACKPEKYLITKSNEFTFQNLLIRQETSITKIWFQINVPAFIKIVLCHYLLACGNCLFGLGERPQILIDVDINIITLLHQKVYVT